jgi:hypothetical protein
MGIYENKESISFSNLANIIEDLDEDKKLNSSDLKRIHSLMYNDKDAINFFAPNKEPAEVSLIKKYKPIPIYSHGNGDHYCYCANGKIKEYIHDALKIFDAEYARDYNSYSEWVKGIFSNKKMII